MAGLGYNDRREVVMVSVPTANFLASIKLVIVLVDLARLFVKHFTTIEVNVLDPFELRANTVLLIVITDVDQDLEAA